MQAELQPTAGTPAACCNTELRDPCFLGKHSKHSVLPELRWVFACDETNVGGNEEENQTYTDAENDL